jgi:carboxyl-terminal processing protease
MYNRLDDNTKESIYTGITITLAIVVAFAVGYAVGAGVMPNELGLLLDPAQRSARLEGDTLTPDEFEVFWEAWSLVESRYYYDVPDDEALTHGAVRGMLGALDDPYTNFTSPEAAELLRETDTGEFQGIGAYVEQAAEGGVLIVRPFEGSPAEQAGLLAGDVIIAVDGVNVLESSLDEALAMVRGPADTDVILTILRENVAHPFDVTVTRGRIEVPTVQATLMEGNVGYVALFEFNQQASSRLTEAVQDLLAQGAESIVLDLRNNPGGFLDQAVDVADLFLPEGDVLIQRDVDGHERTHHSDDGDAGEDVPLVVLVNGGSASASEIVAGAIQDLDRGLLVGEQTFGKGSVQLQYNLSDGSILRVTYAAWFTPDDHAINDSGIEPDLEVSFAAQDGPDTQLEAALEYLQTQQERTAYEQ